MSIFFRTIGIDFCPRPQSGSKYAHTMDPFVPSSKEKAMTERKIDMGHSYVALDVQR